jgi:hypothetical protein
VRKEARVGVRVAVAVAAVVACAACGPRQAPRRELAEIERARLEASLDLLEERLLAGQARVRMWEELRQRHGQVSAVACEVAGRHAEDMVRIAEEEASLARGRRGPRLVTALVGAGLVATP